MYNGVSLEKIPTKGDSYEGSRRVFGENAEQLNDLAVMIPGIAYAESKVKSLDEPLEDKVVENASKSVAEQREALKNKTVKAAGPKVG